MPIAIVLAGIFIASAIYFGGNSEAKEQKSINSFNQVNTVDINNVKTDGNPFIGNPNAPVTIAYWFDYQCPACKYGEATLISPLVEQYVKAGKVKIIFKDFAFLGLPRITDSIALGLTARAVWESAPDKFFAFHKVIYDKQGQENTGWATQSVIDALLKDAGLDPVVINKLVKEKGAEYKKAMEADKLEGSRFGINATPSFIIERELIIGGPRYELLSNFIDNLIK